MRRRYQIGILFGLGLAGLALVSGLHTGLGALTLAGGPAETIRGRVVSEYGPVAGARVRIAGQKGFVLTDRQGRYALPAAHLPSDQRVLVTAGKEGWFNNYTVGARREKPAHIVLNAVPLGDNPGYRFHSPVVCARCHAKIAKIWDKSKMAHTTSNPKVLALYYGTDAANRPGHGPGYVLDNPGVAGNCIVCHAPSIAASPTESRDLKSALQSPRSEWDGISCEYCHKIQHVLKDSHSPSGYKAVLTRLAPRRGNTILVYGPLDDVVAPPMAASYNPLYKEGIYCAVCHSHVKTLPEAKGWDWRKVYTPRQWAGLGMAGNTQLPIQTTFQEWRWWQQGLPAGDPDKGKTCQTCHMSWRKDMLPYDHYIVDGRARAMWGTYRDPETIHPHQFDGGTPAQLRNALSLEVEGKIEHRSLIVTVRVTNTNAGHWVPTGETMRSVLLWLDARDEKGRPLKLTAGERLPSWTGTGDPAHGGYAGQPGAVFARVLEDSRGNLNVPFWRATSIAFDTRIRPKASVTRTYRFSLAGASGEPGVTATLIYRPVPRPLAESKHWKTKDIQITSVAW